MKRSYMVDIIAEFLWKSNGEYGFKHLAKTDAEDLLTIIEREGMQPPLNATGTFDYSWEKEMM